jgi:group II intron reverse transcriptase/maturase
MKRPHATDTEPGGTCNDSERNRGIMDLTKVQLGGDGVPESGPGRRTYNYSDAGVEETSLALGTSQGSAIEGRPGKVMSDSEIESMLTGLNRVRLLARRDKSVRFTQLLQHISPARLALHFTQLNKGAAPGVDGVYWADYQENLKGNTLRLYDKLMNGSYRALPARRVDIPKGPDSTRPLGIVAIEDKVVQHTVADILQRIYEEDFLGFSYGFRPGRGCHDALDALAVAIESKKVNWILDADIQGFFNSISHEHLISFLERRVGDPRILRLIRKWLRAGILEDGQLKSTDVGTQQGGVISPLLSNIFLHYVLDEWVQEWRTSREVGEVVIVRYADDFVMGFQYEAQAKFVLAQLKKRFKEYGLTLHPEKTRLIEFGRFAAENRKRRGQGKPETFDFLGFTHCCSVTRYGRFKLLRKTTSKRFKNKLLSLKSELRKRMHHSLESVAAWLNKVARGYYNYYAIHGNLGMMSSFRYQLGVIWYRTICRRGQKRKMTWEKFVEKWWWRIPSTKALHPYPVERVRVKILGGAQCVS